MLYPAELRAQKQLSNPNINTSETSCQSSAVPNSRELVSGLFSEQEIDPDLEQVIASWSQLSPDLRKAILRIAAG